MLFESAPRPDSAGHRLAGRGRIGARLALAALLAPPLTLVALSALGLAVPSLARSVVEWSPVAGFAAVGAFVGGAVADRRGARVLLATGWGVAGLTIAPAFQSLQGLTGREPVLVVAGVVGGGFAFGFAVMGLAAGYVLGHRNGPLLRLTARSGRLGAIGGAIAILPFLAAAVGLGPAGPYLRVPLAVVAAYACLIVPSRLQGDALVDAASGTEAT